MIKTALILAITAFPVYAGTITIKSPTLNVQAEFNGSLVVNSPTINVTINGTKQVMTISQLRSIQSLSNVLFPTSTSEVQFNINIQK